MKKKFEFPKSDKLRILSLKTYGIAHLIELQGLAQGPSENQEDVFYGISIILREVADALKEVSNQIESE